MNSGWYYVSSDGKASDRHTARELHELFKSGKLTPKTPVWHEDLTGWTPLEETEIGDSGVTHPLRLKRKPKTLAEQIGFRLSVAAVIFGIAFAFYNWISRGGHDLPTCESARGQEEARAVLRNSPAGRTRGIEIVKMEWIRTISTETNLVKCAASVTLNNNQHHEYYYSFTRENGATYVHSSLDLPLAQ